MTNYPKTNSSSRDDVQNIPTSIPNPFNQNTLVNIRDVAAASLTSPTGFYDVVSGIGPFTVGAFNLYAGLDPKKFYFAPQKGRLANRPDGEPDLIITKKVHNDPDGTTTTEGGYISFQIDPGRETINDQTVQSWKDELKRLGFPNSEGIIFQPLSMTNGKMSVYGLDEYALPGQILKDIDIGMEGSISFVVKINAPGADHFDAMLGTDPSPFVPQVAIRCTADYRYYEQEYTFTATGNNYRMYQYFSLDAKARASYFGLFGGSAEYQRVRANLREVGALVITIVGDPPQGVDQQKLVDSTTDRWIKDKVGEWIDPTKVTPAEAPTPDGYFGGFSVSMKDIQLSEQSDFSITLTVSGIKKRQAELGFNFEQQIGSLSREKHFFLEQDDIKLPFVLRFGESDKVKRIIPSASYTTVDLGPRNIEFDAVDGKGGVRGSKGYIQFSFPHRPTSAQITCVVDFMDGFGPGYIFNETKLVTDTGASFQFEPGIFIERTQLFFFLDDTTTNPNSLASLHGNGTRLNQQRLMKDCLDKDIRVLHNKAFSKWY